MTIELLDCTLRDGTYINDGDFGFESIKNIISELDKSNVEILEIGWLLDKEYSINKTYFPSISDIDMILPENKTAQYSLMLHSVDYDLRKIPKNRGKIDIIREMFHKDKYKEAISRSEVIKEYGYKLFYQLVNTNEYNNKDLMEISGLANKIMPDCIYIVDTHGSMFRSDLKRIFEILNENLDDEIKIGFHSHNNLQLAFSLTMDFIELAGENKRNSIVDSTLFGMGRGAGNLATELISEYLNRFYFKNYNTDLINKLIVGDILKYKEMNDWGYNIPYLLSGSFNIHSRYAKYLTDKYDINPEALREVFSMIGEADKSLFSEESAEDAFNSLT